jgi:threonine dehydratase
LELYQTLSPCEVTGFSYRYGDEKEAHIFMSLKTTPKNSVEMIMKKLFDHKYLALDATHDEMAKTHVRYLIGGRKHVS